MKRGPKPTPTAIKKQRGNPGHRKLNAAEPESDNVALPPPPNLDELGCAEWDRVTARLQQQGRLDTVHMATLAGYCFYWSQWLTTSMQVKQVGPLVAGPPSKHDIEQAKARAKAQELSEEETEQMLLKLQGKPHQNPLIVIRDKSFMNMMRCCTELGITPSSQTRVEVDPPNPNVGDRDSLPRGKVASLHEFARRRK